jgi:predicted aspartyl protease
VRLGLDYDSSFDPPAPVVPLRVGPPDAEPEVLLHAIVDSGADCTVLPAEIASALRLPPVGGLRLLTFSGDAESVPVHSASVALAGVTLLRPIAFFGEVSILGRDLLQDFRAVLDGPASRLTLTSKKGR